MGNHSNTGVTVVTCPLPRDVAPHEVTAWLERGVKAAVPVTWIIPCEILPMARAGSDGVGISRAAAALDLSAEWPLSRQELRRTLRAARAAWPELEAAVLHGPAPLDHRDVLVQEGFTTVCVDRFDVHPRGTRRPAPRGWDCRSILWGLWEVAAAPKPRSPLGRVADWCRNPSDRGGLRIWRPGACSAATTRVRLDRHVESIRRRTAAGAARAALLADIPSLIAGNDPLTARGSVLRAA